MATNDGEKDDEPTSLCATSSLSHQISRQPSATQNPSFSVVHEILFVSIICLAQLLTQASLSQTVVPFQYIAASFGITNPAVSSWNTAAFSLTVGTFILVSGRFGDLFGHKRLFIIGWLWFALWSLLAGFAVYSNQRFFACCRAFQGIGPSIILPNGIAILGRTYPPGKRKNLAMSLFGATAPNGFLVGAVFTGIFTEFAWWPWSFWALFIACLCCATISIFVIPPMPVAGPISKSVFSELDPLGALTGIVGLVLINFAWNQGPVVGWPTPYVYILLIIGFLFITAFFYTESHISAHPLLPTEYLPQLTLFVFACVAAGWSSFGIWVFYQWQFWTNLRHQPLLTSAAQNVPSGISGFCAAVTTGFMLSKGVPPGIIMFLALLAFTVGNILYATAPVAQTYWAQSFVAQVVTPWGMDLSFPAAVIILSDSMPSEYQGVAASLVNTVVNYSISIGLGFAGTVERQVNDGGKDVLKGYRGAWYMGTGLAGLGVAVSIVMTWVGWRKERQGKIGKKDEGVQNGDA